MELKLLSKTTDYKPSPTQCLAYNNDETLANIFTLLPPFLWSFGVKITLFSRLSLLVNLEPCLGLISSYPGAVDEVRELQGQ